MKLKIMNKQMRKKYESKIASIQNENKITNINGHLDKQKIKQMIDIIETYEKSLNKIINLLLNERNTYNLFKKEFNKMEKITENDLSSIFPNNYEQNINKAKE